MLVSPCVRIEVLPHFALLARQRQAGAENKKACGETPQAVGVKIATTR